MIHASYFGTQGVTEETLKKHLFQTALRQALNEDGRRSESTDPVVMKLALNRYISNFKNMWSQKMRSRKTLNRVLIVLLRIHLAPKRERRKIEKLTKKKSEKAKNTDKASTKIKLANKSYNTRKKLFKNEKKKREAYIRRSRNDKINELKWKYKATECKMCISKYEETLR
ncbi:hypothetical protein CU097_013462 [Rhizopus azygosporus]|uniref:Uncharacterized protein n=1 Tax=Rhizopus azygosporus TaxID=86630 RepID=A0A367JVY3_RHIAZ|nr:hypothetical protein CU097_013462 [Rhizopus azygosporus]